MDGVENLYHGGSRSLQDRFDTRRIADRLEEKTVRDTIDEGDRAFIEARDMFFIATADAEGRPQSSYKGGDPGFVRVLDERTIAFPNYDGNGMYLTAGNMLVNPNVGLLFIDFEGRKRMRLNGIASVDENDPLAGRVSRGAVRDPGSRDRGLPELPALHPRVQARAALPVRAEGRRRDAGSRLEDARVVARRAAEGRPGVRPRARSHRTGLGSPACRSSFCFPI